MPDARTLVQEHHIVVVNARTEALLAPLGINVRTFAANVMALPSDSKLAKALGLPLHSSSHTYVGYTERVTHTK
jgi:hypothetical protein